MIARRIEKIVRERLQQAPGVVLLGPRQTGKTTIAQSIAESVPSVYLDLESELDVAKLREPEVFLESMSDRLVILDEIHRVPGLFPILRGVIDRARRRGEKYGKFLLLGSASLELLRQSGESLAGRVSYIELGGIDVMELSAAYDAPHTTQDELWLRGGFPDSLLSESDQQSLQWRMDLIRTYLEREIPQFGARIPSETLRRFWTMLAHHQAGVLNNAMFARSLGVDVKTTSRYLDLMVDLLLVRRLQPWHANIGKRLVRSPKVYVRDSGLVHALLKINTLGDLLSHPILGASWEGFVIEQVMSTLPDHAQGYFYRTSGGAEIDLVIVWPDQAPWAVEIKRSTTSHVSRGFHEGCQDLKAGRAIVVHAGPDAYPYSESIEALPVAGLLREIVRSAI
ncbi:MAG: ATP-binding protein [Ignavibacteriae bacterium]|nr:MAG: ATP-binding protein [Ignavibacteriota bacterium]